MLTENRVMLSSLGAHSVLGRSTHPQPVWRRLRGTDGGAHQAERLAALERGSVDPVRHVTLGRDRGVLGGWFGKGTRELGWHDRDHCLVLCSQPLTSGTARVTLS